MFGHKLFSKDKITSGGAKKLCAKKAILTLQFFPTTKGISEGGLNHSRSERFTQDFSPKQRIARFTKFFQ